MNTQKQAPPTLKARLEQAGANRDKLMLQFFDLNYNESSEDRNTYGLVKNYEIFFFDDFRTLLASELTR
jgi:hypothetical protein